MVGGHQRLQVLTDLGHRTASVSVVDLDNDREKAPDLALKKVGGEWDVPMLKAVLESIDTGAIDFEITGFDLSEIEAMMTASMPRGVEGDVPEPPTSVARPVSSAGAGSAVAPSRTRAVDPPRSRRDHRLRPRSTRPSTTKATVLGGCSL